MASEATQQPVNLTVTATGAPIRAGSYPGPYRIINQSLSATIWVSDNPSCAPNAGTSVSPGTSLQWVKSGDLYIILGNDAETLLAGSADVILSYDVSDWQPNPVAIATAVLNSGIIVVDNPAILMNNTLVAGGSHSQTFDVSRYNSLYVQITSSGVNSVCQIWWDATLPSGTNYMGAIPLVFGGQVSTWRAQVPVQGKYFTVYSQSGGPLDVTVVASYRQVDGYRQYPAQVTYQASASNVNVNAGSTINVLYIPPWIGTMWLDLSLSGVVTNAATRVSLDTAVTAVRIYSSPLLVTADNSGFTFDGTNTTKQWEFPMWGEAVNVNVRNSDAAARNVTSLATPRNTGP